MTTDALTGADSTPTGEPLDTRPAPVRGTWRQYVAALRILAVLTAVLGLLYPLAVTGIAQLPGLKDRADGSLVRTPSGAVVGSSLLGQGFVDADGLPLRQWFQSRPSAAGKAGWDGTSSGASNLGPGNPDLVQAIGERKAAIAAFDSVPGHTVAPDQVPADAVTTSASGLDPARVVALVEDHVQGRVLGFLGEETVNVLELNLALAATATAAPQ